MKDLKGTKTEKNLQEAFAGESMVGFEGQEGRLCTDSSHFRGDGQQREGACQAVVQAARRRCHQEHNGESGSCCQR